MNGQTFTKCCKCGAYWVDYGDGERHPIDARLCGDDQCVLESAGNDALAVVRRLAAERAALRDRVQEAERVVHELISLTPRQFAQVRKAMNQIDEQFEKVVDSMAGGPRKDGWWRRMADWFLS